MRMIKIIRLLILALTVALVALPCATYAAAAVSQQGTVQPAGPAVGPMGPKGDGQIANVTTTPSGVWHIGTPVNIQWEWPGGRQADVTLWSGTTQVATIVSGWSGQSVGWSVPYSLGAGTYTIRVQSANNNKNFAETTVRVEPCTLTVTGPKQGDTLMPGATYPITWTWGPGNPGPLKIELISSAGVSTLIKNNVLWGSSGQGKYDWQIPGGVTPGSYQIRVTSEGNSAITATGTAFTVGQPTIVLVEPQAGHTYPPGAKVPIKWTYIGNPGPKVRITATWMGAPTPNLDVECPIGSLGADNVGHGSYDWTPPVLYRDEQFTIRVESTQNPKVFAQVAPITLMSNNPRLVGAYATFYTKNENKDHDTSIFVEFDKGGSDVFARAIDAAGDTPYNPNTSHDVSLVVTKTIYKNELEGPLTVRVGQIPVGNDKWNFTVKVTLRFANGSQIVRESSQLSTLDGRQTINITL